ncbi:hypothetical protein L596_002510 [Steinernema carpocapsae]|uniref:Uncharacterized protein n=1 Tax=Steinernema carpocapsae TaxID=34508 RepID=A0A4U8UPE2_STECR|nr:hypothetical protein L596_002510 [Steinernema carpocapsae]
MIAGSNRFSSPPTGASLAFFVHCGIGPAAVLLHGEVCVRAASDPRLINHARILRTSCFHVPTPPAPLRSIVLFFQTRFFRIP